MSVAKARSKGGKNPKIYTQYLNQKWLAMEEIFGLR